MDSGLGACFAESFRPTLGASGFGVEGAEAVRGRVACQGLRQVAFTSTKGFLILHSSYRHLNWDVDDGGKASLIQTWRHRATAEMS